jgi:hypothetical protein
MTASQQIDKFIKDTPDWRGKQMARLRKLIHEAAPGVEEEWKWNTPVFTKKGMVCALGTFKTHVKVNFFKGASLKGPGKLFNAGLDAKTMRSIDILEGEKLNEAAFKKLVKEAVAFDTK